MKWTISLILIFFTEISWACTNEQFIDAARKGYYSEVKNCLSDKKVDINYKSNNWRSHYGTALHLSSGNGHLKIVKYLLENGADINSIDRDEYSALHRAVENGKKDTAEVLVERGANPYLKTKRGITALGLSARFNDLLEMMISKGIDVNDNENNSSGLIVSMLSHKPDSLRLLISRGANANSISSNAQNILFSLASNTKNMSERFSMASLAIAKGADVNQKSNSGQTPLFAAAFSGKVEVVEYLLKNGASISIKDNKGLKALFISRPETTSALVRGGASVYAVTPQGDTALHYAAWRCESRKIDELLKSASPINPKNNFGITPISIVATRCKDSEVVKVFNDNGLDIGDEKVDMGRYRLYFESKKKPLVLKDSIEGEVSLHALANAFWSPHKDGPFLKERLESFIGSFK